MHPRLRRKQPSTRRVGCKQRPDPGIHLARRPPRRPARRRCTPPNPARKLDPLGLSAEVRTRPLLVMPVSSFRHCFLRFDGDNGNTSSFDPDGEHPDPKPEWGTCEDVRDDDDDECLKREMKKCKGEEYDIIGNNCCHCVENALKACGQGVPRDSGPNWPTNPGPQPGEPGYKARGNSG